MQAELRRQRDTLATSGLAVLVLNFWSLLRSVLFSLYSTSVPNPDSEEFAVLLEVVDPNVIAVTAIAFFAIVLIDFVLTVYVGVSAISEGRGRPRGYAYVVFACLPIVRCVFTMALVILLIGYSTSVMSSLSSFILDFSMLFAFIETVRSSIRTKRLLRDGAAGSGAPAGEG